MGLLDWLSLFTFAWLRRCKTCGERGSKCICKRPSVALEHIFFLEERKNKYGARNFSHVSDTMMTTGTNSSTLTNSTFSASATNFYTNSGSTTYTGTGSTSFPASAGHTANFTNNTVMMNRESVSDCASVDYIYPASQPSIASSATSGASYHRQLPVSSSMNQQHRRHHRRSRRHPEPEPEPEPESSALVRKHSGRMVRKTASAPLEDGFSRFEELSSSNEYMLTADNIEHVTASQRSHRGRSERTTGGMKHRSQQQRSVTFRAENTLVPRRGKQQQGSSFKFYGRGGSGQETAAPAPAMPTTTTPSAALVPSGRSASSRAPSSHSLASSDALVVRPSTTSTSALGSSICSDRMSVDNNFGSYNPRAGRLLEGGYAPSIQEDDEALQRLDGWLHSSPTSTADSFMMSRVMF